MKNQGDVGTPFVSIEIWHNLYKISQFLFIAREVANFVAFIAKEKGTH